MPDLPLPLLSAATGALLAVPVTWFATRRSGAQPVEFDVVAEAALLDLVTTHPDLTGPLEELSGDDFADAEHGLRWRQLCADGPVPSPRPDTPRCAEATARVEETLAAAERALAERAGRRPLRTLLGGAAALTVAAVVVFSLGYGVPLVAGTTPGVASFALASLLVAVVAVWAVRSRVRPPQPSTEPAYVVAGISLAQGILDLSEGRKRLNGASLIVASADRDQPLRRLPLTVSPARWAVGAVAGGAVGALIPSLLTAAPAALTAGPLGLLAGAIVLVLGAVSLHVAIVDADTFYLDTPVFFPAGGVLAALCGVWVAFGWSVGAGVHLAAAVAALAMCATVVGTAIGWVRFRRGVQGWGGGDTKMLPLVVGVPALVSGEVLAGLWVVLTASLLAGIVHGPLALRRAARGEPSDPLPLLPYLAAAWPLAWAAQVFVGL